jgi:hypothetical protein
MASDVIKVISEAMTLVGQRAGTGDESMWS